MNDFLRFLFHKQYTPFYLGSIMIIAFTMAKGGNFILGILLITVASILDSIFQGKIKQ